MAEAFFEKLLVNKRGDAVIGNMEQSLMHAATQKSDNRESDFVELVRQQIEKIIDNNKVGLADLENLTAIENAPQYTGLQQQLFEAAKKVFSEKLAEEEYSEEQANEQISLENKKPRSESWDSCDQGKELGGWGGGGGFSLFDLGNLPEPLNGPDLIEKLHSDDSDQVIEGLRGLREADPGEYWLLDGWDRLREGLARALRPGPGRAAAAELAFALYGRVGPPQAAELLAALLGAGALREDRSGNGDTTAETADPLMVAVAHQMLLGLAERAPTLAPGAAAAALRATLVAAGGGGPREGPGGPRGALGCRPLARADPRAAWASSLLKGLPGEVWRQAMEGTTVIQDLLQFCQELKDHQRSNVDPLYLQGISFMGSMVAFFRGDTAWCGLEGQTATALLLHGVSNGLLLQSSQGEPSQIFEISLELLLDLSGSCPCFVIFHNQALQNLMTVLLEYCKGLSGENVKTNAHRDGAILQKVFRVSESILSQHRLASTNALGSSAAVPQNYYETSFIDFLANFFKDLHGALAAAAATAAAAAATAAAAAAAAGLLGSTWGDPPVLAALRAAGGLGPWLALLGAWGAAAAAAGPVGGGGSGGGAGRWRRRRRAAAAAGRALAALCASAPGAAALPPPPPGGGAAAAAAGAAAAAAAARWLVGRLVGLSGTAPPGGDALVREQECREVKAWIVQLARSSGGRFALEAAAAAAADTAAEDAGAPRRRRWRRSRPPLLSAEALFWADPEAAASAPPPSGGDRFEEGGGLRAAARWTLAALLEQGVVANDTLLRLPTFRHAVVPSSQSHQIGHIHHSPIKGSHEEEFGHPPEGSCTVAISILDGIMDDTVRFFGSSDTEAQNQSQQVAMCDDGCPPQSEETQGFVLSLLGYLGSKSTQFNAWMFRRYSIAQLQHKIKETVPFLEAEYPDFFSLKPAATASSSLL